MVNSRPSGAEWRHDGSGIQRLLALAQLEMKLRTGHVAGGAHGGDGLALLDLIAPADQQFGVMGVGRDITVGMLDQQQVAEPEARCRHRRQRRSLLHGPGCPRGLRC